MDLWFVALLAFLIACVVNYFYWKSRFKKLNRKLFDTQKSYYRSVDITRNVLNKEKEFNEREQRWLQFLQGEG